MKGRFIFLFTLTILLNSQNQSKGDTCKCHDQNQLKKVQRSEEVVQDFDGFTTLQQIRNESKNEELLQLGMMRDPFMGPRRRRRRRSSDDNSHLYYVYSVPFLGTKGHNDNENDVQQQYKSSSSNFDKSHTQTTLLKERVQIPARENEIPDVENLHQPLQKFPTISPVVFEQSEQRKQMQISNGDPVSVNRYTNPTIQNPQKHFQGFPVENNNNYQSLSTLDSLSEAWKTYGPNSPLNPTTTNPNHQFPQFLSRNGDPIQFQPMESEWDSAIGQPPKVESTSLQTKVLSSYIDFELRNMELMNFIRKFAFGLVVMAISLAWLLFGMFLQLVPAKIVLWNTKRNLEEDLPWNNSILKSITEHVSLALEGNWLEKLEEKVKEGGWLASSVSCCILPSQKSQGMAECEVVRKGRKDSTFKCLSDLIYNFNFGPTFNKSES